MRLLQLLRFLLALSLPTGATISISSAAAADTTDVIGATVATAASGEYVRNCTMALS